MNYPESVLDIVKAATAEHPDDIAKATDTALRKIRKLPEFPELVDKLIHDAIQELIYGERHAENCRIRKEAGGGPKPIVIDHKGKIGQAIAQRYYLNLYIGGRQLRYIAGKDLQPLASEEEKIGQGHLWNARLLTALASKVPEDSTVGETLTEDDLVKIVRKINKNQDAA